MCLNLLIVHQYELTFAMNIQVLGKGKRDIRFRLQEINLAFANALRRIMMSEVPCMAMEDVFFYENSTVLNDEMIVHRLGFIPLITDLDNYVPPWKCECKSEMGCSRCRVIATLEAEAKDSQVTIYSGDLKFDDPHIKAVASNIPIVKLAAGQRIRFEAHARLGIGKQHSKWQPVSACAYKIDEKHPDSVEFLVESTGCLQPERIVQEAVKILCEKIEMLVAEVKNISGK